MSAKHLDELEFRISNCENHYVFRDALCKLLVAETVSYGELIED